MALSREMQKLRELFLFDVSFQEKLKTTPTNDDFLNEAINVARSKGLNDVTRDELETAIENYAKKVEGPSPACGPDPHNKPPFSPLGEARAITVDKAINIVRATPNGICGW